jgi:hypothetical protein
MELSELKSKFEAFRKNKKSRGVRFPHYLWEEVAKQIKIHGRSKVQQTLNLRCDQIRNYCGAFFTEKSKGEGKKTLNHSSQKAKQIVEIPNPSIDNNVHESVITLDICDKKINIKTQTSELEKLIPQIILNLGI